LPNRLNVADGGDERRRGHQAHSGHRDQPPDVLRCERVVSDRPFEDRDLGVEEVDLAQASVDGLALIVGQFELGEPRAAALAERVGHRRPALEVAHQHRVDLVLAARALPHELRAARQAPAQRPRGLIGQPTTAQQPRGQKPRERPGVATVGLDLGLGDRAQLGSRRHDHLRDMRLQRPRDRQRVAGRLERHAIRWAEAVGKDLQPRRAARHATGRPNTPAFADRDLAEIQMHV
jgi:hypothetical protein